MLAEKYRHLNPVKLDPVNCHPVFLSFRNWLELYVLLITSNLLDLACKPTHDPRLDILSIVLAALGHCRSNGKPVNSPWPPHALPPTNHHPPPPPANPHHPRRPSSLTTTNHHPPPRAQRGRAGGRAKATKTKKTKKQFTGSSFTGFRCRYFSA